MLRILLLAFICVTIICGGHQACAHAIVIESTPAPDAEVHGPDVSIELKFNSKIDTHRSRLTLFGPGNVDSVQAEGTPLVIAPSSPPDRLESHAAGLAPGPYRLHWQVLATDGHITRGDILFKLTAMADAAPSGGAQVPEPVAAYPAMPMPQKSAIK